MLLENKKKPVPKETGRACLAAVCQTAGGGALLFGYTGCPAAAGGHVDRYLAVGGKLGGLALVVTGGAVGVDAVAEDFHGPVTFAKEGEIKG